MKKTVTMYECDICKATETPEDQKLEMPQGWAMLTIRKSDDKLVDLLICIGCHIAMGNAFGERKNHDAMAN